MPLALGTRKVSWSKGDSPELQLSGSGLGRRSCICVKNRYGKALWSLLSTDQGLLRGGGCGAVGRVSQVLWGEGLSCCGEGVWGAVGRESGVL